MLLQKDIYVHKHIYVVTDLCQSVLGRSVYIHGRLIGYQYSYDRASYQSEGLGCVNKTQLVWYRKSDKPATASKGMYDGHALLVQH